MDKVQIVWAGKSVGNGYKLCACECVKWIKYKLSEQARVWGMGRISVVGKWVYGMDRSLSDWTHSVLGTGMLVHVAKWTVCVDTLPGLCSAYRYCQKVAVCWRFSSVNVLVTGIVLWILPCKVFPWELWAGFVQSLKEWEKWAAFFQAWIFLKTRLFLLLLFLGLGNLVIMLNRQYAKKGGGGGVAKQWSILLQRIKGKYQIYLKSLPLD